MKYKWSEEGKKIRIEGLLVELIELDIKDVVSYLNQLEGARRNQWSLLRRLLMMSLDGRDQVRIQEEVAIMLGYPGIEGFIREVYGVESAKVREKEEKIL